MKLHIIHLPQRKDRLSQLMKELFLQGITEYRTWEGIEDHHLPCRGISKAHKQIVTFAKEMDLPEVLIAEDDIHFTSKKSFDYYLQNKPRDYDIYLGGITWGKISGDNIVRDFSGTHFYTINQRFYDMILNIPETKDLDRALANIGKYVVCHPMIVVQHNGFSDNQKKYMDFTPFFKRTSLYHG